MPVTATPPNCFTQLRARGYDYHVFISWPHLIQEQGRKIVEQLFESLEDRFRSFGGGKVFLDKQRIGTGDKLDPKVRRSVSRSSILLAILVDSYFQSDWCLTEWNIMETLQKDRLPQDADATCFIPVLLHEDVTLPMQINAVLCDQSFVKILSYNRNPKSHSKWNETIDKLVVRIKAVLTLLCQQLTDAQDWKVDEAKAMKVGPKNFTWKTPPTPAGQPRPKRRLPRPVARGSKL